MRAHDSLPGLVSMAMILDAPTRAAVEMTPRPIAPHPKTATVEPSANAIQYCNMTNFDEHELTDSLLFYDSTPRGGDTTTEKTDLLKRCFGVDCDD